MAFDKNHNFYPDGAAYILMLDFLGFNFTGADSGPTPDGYKKGVNNSLAYLFTI